MAYFTLIDDAATQSISGGFLNRSFNRVRTDNRQINLDNSDNSNNSNNSTNTNNSVRNRGFFTGNTISVWTTLTPG